MKRPLFTSRGDAACCAAVYACTAVIGWMVAAPVHFGAALTAGIEWLAALVGVAS